MAQVQFTVAISVTAPPQPLAESASSGPAAFEQGSAGTVVLAQISGGQPPYSASVDVNSPSALPDGITASIDASNSLVLSGTANAVGSAGVLLDVVDATGASAKV